MMAANNSKDSPPLIVPFLIRVFTWFAALAAAGMYLSILLAILDIGYGFATQKSWSRHLVLAIFGLIIVYASILGALNLIHHAIMWRAIINGTLFGGASVWYFYFKPNVAAYFRELANR